MISRIDAVVYPLGVPGQPRPEPDRELEVQESEVRAKVVRTPRRKGPATTEGAETK